MLDTLVIGAGLCGLSLAAKLTSAGRDWQLVEARNRLGGRIETVPESATTVAADLGPSWFWPSTQPRIARLIADLGLSSFPQHDEGTVLHLDKGDGAPEALQHNQVHIGAQRLGGGMGTLVAALAQRLPPERLLLGTQLMRLILRDDHIEAHLQNDPGTTILRARHVVLALPPRLVLEHIICEPVLDESLRAALQATPTWMAAQCKTISRYPSNFWRDTGLSGNAFVTHAQAVLGEIFDASGENGQPAALGGLCAMPASVRTAFNKVFTLMLHSQYGQVFGPRATEGDLLYRDWAQEPFTCSSLDLTYPASHPQDGVAQLSAAQWNGRLFLGGSETAGQSAGYLEGALDATARIWGQLSGNTRTLSPSSLPGVSANQAGVSTFKHAVSILRQQAITHYVNGISKALSSQQSEDMTQIVLIDVAAQTYALALEALQNISFELSTVEIENGRTSLTPELLTAFSGFANELLSDVQIHNSKSCAISNFPLEYNLNQAYLQAIRRDLAALWREFALSLNDTLLDRLEITYAH